MGVNLSLANPISTMYFIGRHSMFNYCWLAAKVGAIQHRTEKRYPVPRTSWNWGDLTASLQWRHIDGVDIERPEAADTFPAFRAIDDYDYLDLYVSYNLWDDRVRLSAGIDNITDENPPVVGNEAGDTAANSGNTFPGNYDTLGRMYTFGARLSF